MRLLDRLRGKTYEGYRQDLLNGDFTIESNDRDFKGLTDDMSILLTRASELFVSGDVVNLKTDESASNETHAKFFNPNPWTDDKSLLKRAYWLYKRYGCTYLYFLGDAWYVLENGNLDLTFKSNATMFNTSTFMDLVDNAYYNNNSVIVDLLNQGGEIVPLYDVAQSHNDFKPVSRVNQIRKTQQLANSALDGINGALKRISMLMLSPKQSTTGVATYNPAHGTDKGKENEQANLHKQFNIKKGAIGVLSKAYDVLQTNPDNGKLKALESLDRAAMSNCAMTSVPYKLLYGQTKFDDAGLHLSLMYIGSMQPDADKFMRVINQKLQLSQPLAIDYSKQLDMLIKHTDTGSNLTTNEADKTQIDE